MHQILVSKEEIQELVKKLANELSNLFKDDEVPPVFIGVLKGSMPFMMDLMKYITIPVQMDFVQVSSFMGTESTGVLKLKKDISMQIANRNVVVIEDIIDSGITLKWLHEYLETNYNPNKVYTCALIDKRCKRKVDYNADYVGKIIDDYFIAGYGLDYYDFYRNTDYIFIPSKEDLQLVDDLVEKYHIG